MADNWATLFDELSNYLGQLTDQDLEAQAVAFAYQGFDPRIIAGVLTRRQADSTKRPTEIYQMIILFLTRGNKFDKIIKKSSEASKKIMDDLLTRYQIRSSKPQFNDDVTLARVAATFPQLTYQVVKRLNPARPCDQWLAKENINIVKYGLKMPGAFALLQSNLQKNPANLNLVKALVVIQYAEAEIINTGGSYVSLPIEAKLTQLLQYARAAFSNAITTAAHRTEFTKDVFTDPSVGILANKFTTIFGSSNDKTLEDIFLN